jgi:hypothetical protein
MPLKVQVSQHNRHPFPAFAIRCILWDVWPKSGLSIECTYILHTTMSPSSQHGTDGAVLSSCR